VSNNNNNKNTKFSNSLASVDVNPEPRCGFMGEGEVMGVMGVITPSPRAKNKKGQQLYFCHIFGGVVCDDVKF
jgi:hypothetical protein